ncbi:Arylsulfatase A [Olivibacter domesticus]|uniref:Arylsulfatase A n=2 Tax=Olivibacter domesticus TaxID=407022 RepID=A0A1H7K6N4_OLID1|nr:Arylsulfatase A [Olivibacter domesticus]
MYPVRLLLFTFYFCIPPYAFGQVKQNKKPNILLIIADDLSKTLPLYGDSTITTPGMDGVAKNGVVFDHAYCSAASCTPSRASILTGKYPHQLAEGGNLHGTLPLVYENYTYILAKNGYRVGLQGKGWGPGNFTAGGYKNNPAGQSYPSFENFLQNQPEDTPFCFWIGSNDPHRPYKPLLKDSLGIDSLKVKVPVWLPNDALVHHDLLDYYAESKRFDQTVERAIALLKKKGIYDQTLIIITSDHGMPFPRVKANAYDMSTSVPLIIRWDEHFMKGKRIKELVSLVDLAPTFLSAAGIDVPKSMVGKSLLGLLTSGKSNHERTEVFTERERHAYVRAGNLSYPMRAIRTNRFLYINNLRPERWPAGDPENPETNRFFGDIDNGPTKQLLLEHQNDPNYRNFWLWSLDKRPAEELYDLETDPNQLKNLANDPSYNKVRRELATRLIKWRSSTNDPVTETAEPFDSYPYYGGKIKGLK